MPKISIIIPVYNVEKYLRECLDSVVNQTLDDIEIICVDDCSTDSSPQILEEYAQKDSRIQIIHHDTNKGLGPSRNTGLDNANSKYIFFLDSDDYLKLDIFENLHNKILETKSDIVISKSIAFTQETDEYTTNRVKGLNEWLEDESVVNYQVDINNYISTVQNFSCISCGKLFSSKFLQDNDLKFINKKVVHEDNGFWLKVCANNPKITTIDNVGIMYRIRPNAITSVIDKDKNKNFKFKNMKMVLKDAFDYFKEHFDNNTSETLVHLIKNSKEYSRYFEIRMFCLRFRWTMNNKRITICGIPFYSEKFKDNHKVRKFLGVPIYSIKEEHLS